MKEKIKKMSPSAMRVLLTVLLIGPQSRQELIEITSSSSFYRTIGELKNIIFFDNNIKKFSATAGNHSPTTGTHSPTTGTHSPTTGSFYQNPKVANSEELAKKRNTIKNKINTRVDIHNSSSRKTRSNTNSNLDTVSNTIEAEREELEGKILDFSVMLEGIGIHTGPGITEDWGLLASAIARIEATTTIEKAVKRMSRYFREYAGDPKYKIMKSSKRTILETHLYVFFDDKELEGYLMSQELKYRGRGGNRETKGTIGSLDSYEDIT